MSKLLSPVQIAKLSLKNRVVMSPMCQYAVQAEDGLLTPFHFAHYLTRAMGQVGLIITESTAVTPEGRITNNDLGLWNDQQADRLHDLITQLHQLGAKAGVQLNHAGRKAADAKTPVGPSDQRYDDSYKQPHPLTVDEIHTIVDEFQAAAKRATKAGVDVIEIHGAHGYLIDQFLSPALNQRHDPYSGSLQDRYRLLHEVVDAIRREFHGSLWVRLSLTDYMPAGQQTSLSEWQRVAQWLQRDDVDLIDASTGGLFPKKPDFPVHDGYQTRFATALKQAVDIPVATVGLLDNPGLAEYILQNRQADLIVEGRALLRNPNWVATADIALHDHQLERDTFNHSYYRGMAEH
ncbi:oxidoreductase [Levilactobacillus suantsaii]|uniref:NADH:flavin oxidoreductase/NADH oxidase n=1 Tax=Levilactobacillus suantsaii TaxID=2292255 RepID=A0A4Q0VGE3_9LACO|nr:NADH:flavin oxidoreductase/NADH oxidase [Levilactobacillus suantsaii]RXI76103.1 NADH:flavin oxidoreductase/NADH oxidase [Levilactobacillus suantsaii]